MTTVILAATALAVFAVVEAIYYGVRYSGERKKVDLRRRLAAQEEGTTSTSLLRERRLSRNPSVASFLREIPLATDLERTLLQTSLSWNVDQLLAIAVILCAALVGFGMVWLRNPLLAGLLGLLGLGVPFVVVGISRTKRSQQVSEQLPEALDMMVRSLRAGHGISAAFKLVAKEMPTPVAVEFARCYEEISVGVEFRDAVSHMVERVPGNLDLKIFSVSVVLQHETGGNLVELLDQIAATIRRRYEFYGKLAALTSEAKMSGIFMAALPPLTVAFVMSTNRSYFDILGEDPRGPFVVVAGIALWLGGLGWLLKLSKVEY